MEVRDNGKLIAEMGAQAKLTAEWYRYYGGLADKLEGSVIPLDRPGILNYTKHEPLGVVGLITAWNSPLLLLAWKLAAALAAGTGRLGLPRRGQGALGRGWRDHHGDGVRDSRCAPAAKSTVGLSVPC